MSQTPRVVLTEESHNKRKHAAYMRQKRKSWTDDEKERNRELSKLRMRKRREKLKQELRNQTLLGDTRQTRLTKQKELERKKVHTEYKRKYRAQLSSQKKRRIREKDAAKKKEKRAHINEKKKRCQEGVSKVCSNAPPESSCSSSAAWQKMVYRAKKRLPKSPTRYAAVVKGLATCVTPKKKAALREQGIASPKGQKNLAQFLDIMKDVSQSLKGTSNENRRKRREFVKHFAERLKEKSQKSKFCAVTGIKRKYLNICNSDKPRKRRKDAVPSEVQESVQSFYESEEVAAVIPDKKAVKKDLEQTQVMQMSLTTAWSKWKSENPEKQLSFDKFRKFRPKKVMTQKYRKLFQCLCEYCENVKLKLTSVNRLAERVNRPDLKLQNEFEAVSATLCPKGEEKFHKLSCIDRVCKECGSEVLKEKLRPLFEIDDQPEVKWNRWETVKSLNPKTQKEISKRQEVEKSGLPLELISELLIELEFLSLHLFEAQWQQQQFASLNKSLPDNSVSITVDFAENYTCFCQNEIQGAHWSKDSVTIHPCICLYKCPKDDELVDECVDIVSDDLNHDSHAVYVFLTYVIRHLKEARQVPVQHAYVISDGCASQYKCKISFMDVSCSINDYQINMERSYYGSRHGKNRCDGEAGVLKSKATRDVKNRVANIYNARTFFNSVKALEKPAESEQGICLHKRRTLIFVSADAIQHERPERDCKTVKGTRKLHSVLGVERGVIKTRRLSCFCAQCLQSNYDQCLNTKYVDNWRQVVLKPLIQPAPEVQVTADAPELPQAADAPAVPPAAEVQQAPFAPEVRPDAPELPPAADAPAVPPAAEVQQAPFAPEVRPDAPELPPAADAPAAPPAAEVQQAPLAPEVEEPSADVLPAAKVLEFHATNMDQPMVNMPDATDGIFEDQSLYGDLSSVDTDISFGDVSLGDGDVSFTTLLESLDTEPQYTEGDFVLVKLGSGKRAVEYVAEVKRLLPNNEVILKYMEKTFVQRETFYRWPLNDDISQEHVDSILKKISDPVLVEEKSSTRIQLYRFVSN